VTERKVVKTIASRASLRVAEAPDTRSIEKKANGPDEQERR
jgi:hypothetical protein